MYKHRGSGCAMKGRGCGLPYIPMGGNVDRPQVLGGCKVGNKKANITRIITNLFYHKNKRKGKKTEKYALLKNFKEFIN